MRGVYKGFGTLSIETALDRLVSSYLSPTRCPLYCLAAWLALAHMLDSAKVVA